MSPRTVHLRVPATCRPRGSRDRERSAITESIEEYVEGIWRLQQEVASVGTGDLAQYMNVAPASVSPMLRRLAEHGLVAHTPYQGVRCTARGHDMAVSLLRKHRLLECLLVDLLGLPWDGVHELACKLEHHISDDVANRIASVVGHPDTCPHGNPIDATRTDEAVRLADVGVGQAVVVARVTDERAEFLAYLLEVGLVPPARALVLERPPFGDVMTLRLDDARRTVPVGREVANAVWVRREANGGSPR
ncbi:MAG: metal-dependent transcriptional regulator [Chthonomonadales bacterium]|nr:metal-dependent transcriptional regulator [Chthonomonadales bacterium]